MDRNTPTVGLCVNMLLGFDNSRAFSSVVLYVPTRKDIPDDSFVWAEHARAGCCCLVCKCKTRLWCRIAKNFTGIITPNSHHSPILLFFYGTRLHNLLYGGRTTWNSQLSFCFLCKSPGRFKWERKIRRVLRECVWWWIIIRHFQLLITFLCWKPMWMEYRW